MYQVYGALTTCSSNLKTAVLYIPGFGGILTDCGDAGGRARTGVADTRTTLEEKRETMNLRKRFDK
jgi:hypothetical protein